MRCLLLARRGPERHHARVDRREVGVASFEREGARRGLRLQGELGVVQGEGAQADAVSVGVQQRDRVLGSQPGRLDLRQPHRVLPRHHAALPLGLAAADQRQEELRHRAEIGLADRADAADARMQALVQHGAQGRGEGRRQSRRALRDAGEADQERGSDFFRGHKVADADGARHHGVALEFAHLFAGELGVDRSAQAGVEAIDRAAARRELFDDPAAAFQPRWHGGGEAHSGAIARHRHDIGDGNRAPANLDRPPSLAGGQRITPLALRKAAAT